MSISLRQTTIAGGSDEHHYIHHPHQHLRTTLHLPSFTKDQVLRITRKHSTHAHIIGETLFSSHHKIPTHIIIFVVGFSPPARTNH
ncbi:hypothetical protein BCR34DRAFT_565444 [Clohesyomyces aquaticus]|uniref:Uncharacterized protein n=1 Tax=Clohesyomyces aquaticus TaxID=1231657 RepID=A0A1Y1ZNC7_9PLEO|nr:hypothetical protein BCR34DRAFT_565444 [Clohesyomyces aquaticus]